MSTLDEMSVKVGRLEEASASGQRQRENLFKKAEELKAEISELRHSVTDALSEQDVKIERKLDSFMERIEHLFAEGRQERAQQIKSVADDFSGFRSEIEPRVDSLEKSRSKLKNIFLGFMAAGGTGGGAVATWWTELITHFKGS